MLSSKYRISLAKFNQFGQKARVDKIVLSIGNVLTEVPKFAIVVPSKCCRKAVSRNRTKRLAWQAIAKFANKVKPAIYQIKICDDLSKLNLDQVLPRIEAVFVKAGKILK